MALSGSFYLTRSAGTQYLQGRVEWTATQSVADNKSTVTTRLIFRRTNEGYETYGDGTFTLTVNGQTYSQSKHYNFFSTDNVILSATTVVPHNADGSKSFTISASYTGNSPIGGSGSKSFDLTAIPRASSISSGISFYAGDTLAVTINRASSGFTHDIQVQANGTTIKTVTGVGASTTISFSDTEVTNLVSRASGGACPITLRLTTKNGGTTIGSPTSKSGTCYVRPSTITTSADFTIGSGISATISRVTSGYTHTVQLLAGGSVITQQTGRTTTASLTPTASTLYAKTPNSNTLPVILRCITYRGSAKIGETDVNGTASVDVEAARPTFSTFTYADTSPAASVTGNNQVLISGISNPAATISTTNKATSPSGATIQKYIFSCGDQSVEKAYSSTASVVLNLTAVTSGTLTVTAVDSRGNQKVITRTASFVEYTPPVIKKVELIRENGVGDKVTVNFTGSIYTAKALGNVSNGVKSLSYKWRKTGATAWTTGGTALPAQTAYTGAIRGDLSGGFTGSQSFDVQVTFQDRLSSTQQQFQLNSGVPVMDLYRTGNTVGVAVGQRYSTSNSAMLQVPGGVSANFIQTEVKSGLVKADATGKLVKAVAEQDYSTVPNENLLINGDFIVWQRGSSFSAPSNVYTADRWLCSGSGTVAKVTGGGMKITGSVTVKYVLEDEDYQRLKGQTVTLSLSINGSVTKSTFAVSSATVISRTVSSSTINWAKLELGSVATPRIFQSYEKEFQRCRRYYRYENLVGSAYNTMVRFALPRDMCKLLPTVIAIDYLASFRNGTGWDLFTYKINVQSAGRLDVDISSSSGGADIKGTGFAMARVKLDAEVYPA